MRHVLSRAVLSALALGTVVACNADTAPEAEQKGVKQGLLNGPDLVVTALSAPPSAMPGSSFSVTLTVCNQGNVGVNAVVGVGVAAHPHASVATDLWLGNVYAGYLSPGACATPTVAVSSPQQGRWYLGAIVDPHGLVTEVNEGNNTRLSAPMGIGYGPDFIVTAVKGPPGAQPGAPFTASVTVCNQGTQTDSTTVELYLSADAIIQPGTGPQSPDMRVAGAPVSFLNPGQCTTVPMTGYATPPPPGTEGPYHLGAVVDPTNNRPELLEDNNTNAGYVLGVGYRPDFVITDVKGPASVQPGQALTAQVTVCNQGTTADSTDVGLFLSADANIHPPSGPTPPEDGVVGMTYVGFLSPGQCITVPVSGNAYLPPPGTEGAWYLGAVVDPGNSRLELIEDNNTGPLRTLGVGYRPDFTVTSVKGPTSVVSGQALTAQVTVCNQGTQPDSTDVGLFLSADANIRASTVPGPVEDAPVGFAPTSLLYPGQCATVSVSGNAYLPPPGTDGAWYLGAVVDPNNNRVELLEDNNANAGYVLGVGSRADFIVTAVKGPTSVVSGQNVTAQVTVCNQGTQPDSTDVGLFLSADGSIVPSTGPGPMEDFPVGFAPVGPLTPGQCATVPVSGPAYPPAPGTEGAYRLGAFVDPHKQRPELQEDNNANAGYVLGVGNRPDFVVTAITSPTSVLSGQSVTAQVTVCNQGTQPGNTDVAVLLSVDDVVRMPGPPGQNEDAFVGMVPVGTLNPGQCATMPVTGPAYPPPPGADGAYFLGAVVDPGNNRVELIDDNNVLTGTRIGVGTRPELVVTAVSAPTSVRLGAALTTSVTVCNRGTAAATTDVDLFFSVDTVIRLPSPPRPPEDIFLGTVSGVALAVGQCTTRSLTVNANAPSTGSYYVGAAVDPRSTTAEFFEDNNTLAGTFVSVAP
jgi:subtilase family serine protease